ncbi:MAG: rod shape-determining protein RodA [Elusimicrobiales bacterium]|nr:rod shape-determining protein RodA [Elusimicrobiales bacterium]
MNESLTGWKKSRIDIAMLFCMLVLLFLGTLVVISSVSGLPHHERIVRVQLMALPLGLAAFFAAWKFNYQIFQDQWKFIYGFLLAFLGGVLIFGVTEKGACSWYRLPFFSIQPSEFARLGVILVIANYLDRRINKIKELKTVLGAFAICIPVFFLLMLQPDFSAIVATFPVVLLMLFIAGASLFHLAVILGYGFISGIFPILWTLIALHPELTENPVTGYFYRLSESIGSAALFAAAVALFIYVLYRIARKFYVGIPRIYFLVAALVIICGFFSGMFVQSKMKDYQQKRLEVFLSPESDPRGAGYNLLQARIAIGSGGLLGKGLHSGTQSRLGFVPERHTDFILAVAGEELGFFGMTLIAGLYVLLMRRIMSAAKVARDRYGYLVCGGIFSMFLVYFSVNFGMMLGFAPVAGIPLPLISYGGSNLVATMIALGIAQSVYSRRTSFV